MYSLSFLIKKSTKFTSDERFKQLSNLINILTTNTESNDFFKILKNDVSRVVFDDSFKVTKKVELFLLAHFSVADVSLWSDFELIKEKLKLLVKLF